MTLFDVFSRREADDAGLPQQASDAELLDWGMRLRRVPATDDVVIDLRDRPKHAARRPLVAAPEPEERPVRRALRARPLVAAPATHLDHI